MTATDLSVIYIMGYGRSGSTLLDTILNNHADITSVGALSNFFEWAARNERCACGSAFRQCEFWSLVYQDFADRMGQELGRYKKVQLAVESQVSLPRSLCGGLSAAVTSEYARMTQCLFESIAQASGTGIIVDSSKSARETSGRAYALKRYTSLDVRLIHLVRDVRGVVWSAIGGPGSPERSQSRSTPLRAANAVAGWILANTACLCTAKRLGRDAVLTVRYEDLVLDPTTELGRIGSFLALDMTGLSDRVRSCAPLNVGHNLGGNRLRFSGAITLKPDFEWQSRLPQRYRYLALCAWPFMKKFKYKLRVPSL